MCEPTHSIVQYPSDDDNTISPSAIRPALTLGLRSRLLDWVKKVGNWLHLSKLGSGHSESKMAAGVNGLYLPTETCYEAQWWDRTVHFDGQFNSYHRRDYTSQDYYGRPPDFELLKQEALECAEGYAHRVSIGSLGQLRTFLEVSLRQSTYKHKYVNRVLVGLLNQKGRDVLFAKLKRLLDIQNIWQLDDVVDQLSSTSKPLTVEQLIKVVVGFTRQRELLCAAWADDGKLWVPKPQLLVS